MAKDRIYTNEESTSGSFEFNDSVAAVFPDMLRRSIPGYDTTIDGIGSLARRFVKKGTCCYDLGCSLGAATLAIRRNVAATDCEIVAVDLAPAMVERCRQLIDRDDGQTPVKLVKADIRDVDISNASMVVMNYTLQFLPVEERAGLVRKIFAGMNEGAVFVLSEKVACADPETDKLMIDLHLDFKRANAYSDLEISRKRTALENVLIPETTSSHLQRILDAGFATANVWLRHLNFVSILAIR